jgi:hypothetical protein
MPHRLLTRLALAFIGLLVCCGAAFAHEFKLDLLLTTFVRIDDAQAHVLVRVPIELLRSAKLPVKGAEIDVAQAGPAVDRAVAAIARDLVLYEDGRALAPATASGRLALPSDRSFETYEKALRHVATPLEPGIGIVVDQGYVDAHVTYAIASPASSFALKSGIAPDLGPALKVSVRFIPPDGAVRPIVMYAHSGAVTLNPGWVRAASSFVGLGIAHILGGIDHLLFLLCLLMPLRTARQMVTVVTGFTLAHSFTLIGSAFNLSPEGAWFPPFVETVIAMSIVYMALENIMGADFRRRVLLTMLFGLVHGFGFSYGLREDLQFAGSHLLVALFAFNVGIEIGQLLVLAVMLPLLIVARRYVFPGRIGEIVTAALLAHVGWHWMTDRWADLARVPWPSPDAHDVAALLVWITGLALAASTIAYALRRLRLDSAPPVTAMRASQ